MKVICFILTIFFVSSYSFSVLGQTQYQDVVYLKNGSIIKGIIIEQVPNVSLKVQTNDGSVFVYKMEDVEKITKEIIPTEEKENFGEKQENYEYKYDGFISILRVGIQTDLSSSRSDLIVPFNISFGYQVLPYFSFGMGLGIEYYDETNPYYYYSNEYLLLPIFFQTRGNFIAGKISPTASFDIGYSLISDTDFDQVESLDIWLNLGFGGKIFLTQNTAYIAEIGVHHQAPIGAFFSFMTGFSF